MKTLFSFWSYPCAAALALACAGCASTPHAELKRPLPFRVALIPADIEQGKLSAALDASNSKQDPRLELGEDDLTASLVAALGGRGFVDMEPLIYEEGESGLMPFETWVKRAQASGADLLMLVKLIYEPGIEGHINEKFWLNLPLFLLGGPFCYFIDDRTYVAAARMQVQFYCLNQSPSRSPVLPLPIQVEYNGSELDFIDRAGSNVGAYAVSLIVPAGLLWPNSERIPGEVSRDAVQQLAAGLIDQIAIQQEQFNRLGLAHFWLNLDGCSVHRRSDGCVDFRVTVLDDGTGLERFAIRTREGELFSGDLSATTERVIEQPLDVPSAERFVQLEIVDGGLHSRSFTFWIEPAEAVVHR